MTAQNETHANLPALLPPAPSQGRRQAADLRAEPGFAAQLLGAGLGRRGLRGGAPVLTAARTAYLDAQWSGPADRRLPPGALRATRA